MTVLSRLLGWRGTPANDNGSDRVAHPDCIGIDDIGDIIAMAAVLCVIAVALAGWACL